MINKRQDGFGITALIVCIVLLVTIGAVGWRVFNKNKAEPATVAQTEMSPDEVFKNYLLNTLKTESLAQKESYKGTGATIDVLTRLDVSKKKLLSQINYDCSPEYNNKKLTFKATVQIENEKSYFRLNKVEGTYTNNGGDSFDLEKVFANTLGTWYVMPENRKALSAQLASGVFPGSSGIIAPRSDTNLIADKLVAEKLIAYDGFKKNDSGYSLNVSTKQSDYRRFLKKYFPKLKNQDLVMDELFGEKESRSSELFLDSNASLLYEKLPGPNSCNDVVSIAVGEVPSGMATTLEGRLDIKDSADVQINEVKSSKPFLELGDDMSI